MGKVTGLRQALAGDWGPQQVAPCKRPVFRMYLAQRASGTGWREEKKNKRPQRANVTSKTQRDPSLGQQRQPRLVRLPS